MLKTYPLWSVREDFSDVIQNKYQQKYAKTIKGMKISLSHLARKTIPDKKFKFTIKFNVTMEEVT